ncbi:MAG TPA: hypothetical protein VK892_00710 [Pyrinomonadaceae bacterium]|nr:hypothetical protein [Pyrinomonadaceae bacterium]
MATNNDSPKTLPEYIQEIWETLADFEQVIQFQQQEIYILKRRDKIRQKKYSKLLKCLDRLEQSNVSEEDPTQHLS